MRRLIISALLAALVALGVDGAAVAKAADGAQKDKGKPAAVKGEVPSELLMQEVEIRGELERPDVFYIIPRRKATMDLGVLSKDYKEEIMQPLLPQHFEKVHGKRKK